MRTFGSVAGNRLLHDSLPQIRRTPDGKMEKARTARELVGSRGFGCLSTQSLRHPGFPFVSIAEYATGETGQPVFLLSGLAVHSKNLALDPRASLIVFAPDAEQGTLRQCKLITFTG